MVMDDDPLLQPGNCGWVNLPPAPVNDRNSGKEKTPWLATKDNGQVDGYRLSLQQWDGSSYNHQVAQGVCCICKQQDGLLFTSTAFSGEGFAKQQADLVTCERPGCGATVHQACSFKNVFETASMVTCLPSCYFRATDSALVPLLCESGSDYADAPLITPYLGRRLPDLDAVRAVRGIILFAIDDRWVCSVFAKPEVVASLTAQELQQMKSRQLRLRVLQGAFSSFRTATHAVKGLLLSSVEQRFDLPVSE